MRNAENWNIMVLRHLFLREERKRMNQKNVRTKRYIGRNDRFADLCNYYLFHGEPVIQPECLIEKDVTELGIPFTEKGSRTIEKIRDLLRSCAIKSADGVTYLIIGIENQSEIHYAMVVRNMVQDALNYAAQVEAATARHHQDKDLRGDEFLSGFAKDDKLIPVVTITLYWKAGAWDGPRSLHEMFDVQKDEILKYVPDYRMNLIVPDEIKDFELFRTELGTVLEFCQCSNNKDKIKQLIEKKKKDGIYLERESFEVLNECLNVRMEQSKQEGELREMCKAMEDWAAEERAEGRAEGEERLGKLICVLLSQDKVEEVKKVAEDVGARKEYYTLYNI